MICSRLERRSIRVGNEKTTASLEPEFWDMLSEICDNEGKKLHQILKEIDHFRGESLRASAIRVYVLKYYCAQAAASSRKGHNFDNTIADLTSPEEGQRVGGPFI